MLLKLLVHVTHRIGIFSITQLRFEDCKRLSSLFRASHVESGGFQRSLESCVRVKFYLMADSKEQQKLWIAALRVGSAYKTVDLLDYLRVIYV